MLSLDDKWVWDFWLTHDGKQWHIFHLQAPKALGNEQLRHENASQGTAVSEDLINWEHLGTYLTASEGPAWDDKCVWTGSVVKGDDGLWHLFYTGNSKAENWRKQRIGHATSQDLRKWVRVGDGLCLDIDPAWYEEYDPEWWPDGRAFRDPWVMRDPECDGWIMYFTARVPTGEETNARGAIGFARSDDLFAWTLQPPVYAGGDAGQLEVPQVFKLEDKWYCLFCNDGHHWSKKYAASYPGAPVTGTHYLMADSHLGPWTIAPGPYLDGDMPCRHYAGRTVDKDGQLFFMAFDYWDDEGNFRGTIGRPVPVNRDKATGLLSLDTHNRD